jgi:hypothetical protein
MQERPHGAADYAAMVVACIDGRLRRPDGGLKPEMGTFLESSYRGANLDHLGYAGASVRLTLDDPEASELYQDVALSYHGHRVRRAVIVEHNECGKYEELGLTYPGQPEAEQLAVHDARSAQAADLLRASLPELQITRFFCTLDGKVHPLSP